MIGKVKVVIADDSSFMRLVLKDIFKDHLLIEVIGIAGDGKEAVEQTIKLKPDVLVLDMEMPQYNGLYAVRKVMKVYPLPILIISGLNSGAAEPIFKALDEGAVDYISKPKENIFKIRSIEKELARRIVHAARIPRSRLLRLEKKKISSKHSFLPTEELRVIVIGASTGGPGTVERILSKIPENFPGTILIAQHMPTTFLSAFSRRLDGSCALPVVLAHKGTELKGAHVYIANGEGNTILVKDKRNSRRVLFDVIQDRFPNHNNPSITALMKSVATIYTKNTIGVILTGMGKDGLDGMIKIKELGGQTLVQDENTSVVYGMPKVVKQAGIADFEVPVTEVSSFIVQMIS